MQVREATGEISRGGPMKAKDLMIPLQEYLTPDMPLVQAGRMLRAAKRGEEQIGVKGLPVLDAAGKMVGFLSIGDILKAVFPSYMALMNLGDFTWDGMVEDFARKAACRRVEEVMTKEIVTVPADAPLMECIDHMIRSNVKRLPVVDAQGKVVGMLYERDVFYAISRAMDEGARGACK
jgi:CBS domain-containing protein